MPHFYDPLFPVFYFWIFRFPLWTNYRAITNLWLKSLLNNSRQIGCKKIFFFFYSPVRKVFFFKKPRWVLVSAIGSVRLLEVYGKSVLLLCLAIKPRDQVLIPVSAEGEGVPLGGGLEWGNGQAVSGFTHYPPDEEYQSTWDKKYPEYQTNSQ